MNLKVALDWGKAGMGFRARGHVRDRMCVLVEGTVCGKVVERSGGRKAEGEKSSLTVSADG